MNDYPCSLLDPPSLIIYLRKLVGVSLKAFNPSKPKFYWSLSVPLRLWDAFRYLNIQHVETWAKYGRGSCSWIYSDVDVYDLCETISSVRNPTFPSRTFSCWFCLFLYSFVDSSIRPTSDHRLAVYYSCSCSLYRCLTLVALLSNCFMLVRIDG